MRDVEEFTAWLDAQPEVQPAFTPEAYDLARALLHARKRAGLTQAQVAARMQTTSTVVSRLESAKARSRPSLQSIERFAAATGHRVRVVLEPLAADT